MALPNGDLITTVFDPQMAYPVDKRMQVDTLNSRDSMSMFIRWEGMEVYVLENSKKYILQGGRSNEYWKETGTGTGTGGTTFVGQFPTSDLLPTSGRSAGDYAFVGTGDDFVQYNWDNIANQWVMAEGQTDMASEFFHIGYKTPLRRPVIFPLLPKDVLVQESGDFVFTPETAVARFIFVGEVTAIRGIETAAADREIKLVNRTGSDIILRDKSSGIPSDSGFDFGGTDYTWVNGSEITLKGNGTYWELAPNNQIAFSDHLDSVNAQVSVGSDGLEVITGVQDKFTGENVTYKEILYTPPIIDGNLFTTIRGKYFKKNSLIINIEEYGASPYKTPSENVTAIQKVLDVIPSGGTMLIPEGVFQINVADPNEYILKIKRANINIIGTSRTGSVIKIADGSGNYYGILGTKLIDGVKWTVSNLTFDHNQANNPLSPDSEYTSKLRYTISAYPKISDTILIQNIDVLNCDSVVSLYFPQSTIRSKQVTIRHNRWINAYTQRTFGDYDQSLVNAAGEVGDVSFNTFTGLSWDKAPRTAIETHFSKNTVIGNIIDKFQVGLNITGMSRTGIDFATIVEGNSVTCSRFGIATWSYDFADSPSTLGIGLCGINVSGNTINMRPDLYPSNYTEPRGSGILTWNGSRSLNTSNLKINDNTITYGDGINIPPLTSDTPYYCAGISISNSVVPDIEFNLLDISDNTVINSPFAALSIDFGVYRALNINNNNFLDCCINSVGGVSTPRGCVVYLNGSFFDAPVLSGGKISFHKDTTVNDVIYYRDRSTTPKTLTVDTQIDVFSANSSSLLRYIGLHTATGATVLFKSVLNGTLKTMPLGAVIGSKCTHNGIVLKRTVNQWISEFYTDTIPTTGTHAIGSIAYKNTPTVGGNRGWICTATGTPGSWVPFGNVGADTDFNELYFKASHITTAYDLNTVTDGFVARSGTSNFTNAPKETGPWLVQDIAAPGINVQTAWLLTADEIYTRRYYGSVWHSWIRVDTPDSDSVTKGKIEIATAPEVAAGEDSTRAVVPSTLYPSGTTAQRPSATKAIGFRYFDTTLGREIQWNGTTWVDSSGATTFPALTDTPANYTGHKNKSVKVNNEETALVFVADGVDVRNITDGGSIAPALTSGYIGSRLNFTSSTAVTLQGFTSAGGQSSVTLVNPHATNNLTLVHNGADTVKYIDSGATDLVIAPKTAVKLEIVGNEIYRVL